MKNTLLIIIGLTIGLNATFTRSTAGVVVDSSTNLQWQDDYSDNSNAIKSSDWEMAISYCENLTLDGGSWRLPNITEIFSLVDATKKIPAIDSAFTNTKSATATNDAYWSSTSQDVDKTKAWISKFDYGSTNYDSKTNTHFIRCVR